MYLSVMYMVVIVGLWLLNDNARKQGYPLDFGYHLGCLDEL